MRTNEGLVGRVIETMAPVAVADTMSDPRYKYFPETGEERYHSFLGVPMRAGKRQPIGVLVAQTLRRRKFSRNEIMLLTTAASQVAQILSHFRLRETLATKEREREEYRRRMIEANRQLKDYEKIGGKPRLAAPQKIRRPRLVGLRGRARFRSRPRPCGRHLSLHGRSQSARARPPGRTQAAGGSALAITRRAGRVEDPDDAADGRGRPRNLRRPSADPGRRRVYRPDSRFDQRRLLRPRARCSARSTS